MAKKKLDDLLSEATGASENETQSREELDASTQEEPATPSSQEASGENGEGGILQPLTRQLDLEQKFDFFSNLMDYIGKFLVKIIDFYDMELLKVSNAVSLMQNATTNHCRYITEQVATARREGLLKDEKKPFAMPGQFGMQTPSTMATEKGKKAEVTREDIQEIASSIRNLIKQQKGISKKMPEEPASTPADDSVVKTETGKSEAIVEKLERYKKTQAEQRTRMEKSVKGPGAPRPSKKQGKPKHEMKDLLPKGFKDKLLENIKQLMDEKDKGKEKGTD